MISDTFYCEGCNKVIEEVFEKTDQYMAASNLVTDVTVHCECGSSDLVPYDEKAAYIFSRMKIQTECKYGRYWYAWDDNSYDGEPLPSHEDEDEAIDELILETIEGGTYE